MNILYILSQVSFLKKCDSEITIIFLQSQTRSLNQSAGHCLELMLCSGLDFTVSCLARSTLNKLPAIINSSPLLLDGDHILAPDCFMMQNVLQVYTELVSAVHCEQLIFLFYFPVQKYGLHFEEGKYYQ